MELTPGSLPISRNQRFALRNHQKSWSENERRGRLSGRKKNGKSENATSAMDIIPVATNSAETGEIARGEEEVGSVEEGTEEILVSPENAICWKQHLQLSGAEERVEKWRPLWKIWDTYGVFLGFPHRKMILVT